MDLAVIAAALAASLLMARGWRDLRVAGLTAAFAAAAVTAFVLAGARWQLLPAGAVALAGVAATGVAGLRRRRVGDALAAAPRRPFLGVIAAVVALVGGALGWAFPVPALPAPNGPFGVGTTTFVITDPDRPEAYTDDPDDVRRFPVQVWYPTAAATAGEPEPLIAPDQAGAFSRAAGDELGLPAFALTHLDLVATHAHAGAPPADTGTPLPVVVYSHGWTGFRNVHVDLMEELASRGFVAVAADHTYGALATRYPDGDVVPVNPEALPDGAAPDVYDRAATRLEDTFAADVGTVLEALADPADDRVATSGRAGEVLGELAGRLDLDHVVLTGHSTGGGAVTWVCGRLDACAGVVGFDPWLEPVPADVIAAGAGVPYLALRSAAWVGDDNDAVIDRFLAASTGPTWRLAVDGSAHRDFTLLGYLSPLAAFFGAGDVDVDEFHQVVEDLTVAFVDHVLHDGPADLLVDPPDGVSRR